MAGMANTRRCGQLGIQTIEVALLLPVVLLMLLAIGEPLVLLHRHNQVHHELTKLANLARDAEFLQADFWSSGATAGFVGGAVEPSEEYRRFAATREAIATKFEEATKDFSIEIQRVVHLDKVAGKDSWSELPLGYLPPGTSAYVPSFANVTVGNSQLCGFREEGKELSEARKEYDAGVRSGRQTAERGKAEDLKTFESRLGGRAACPYATVSASPTADGEASAPTLRSLSSNIPTELTAVVRVKGLWGSYPMAISVPFYPNYMKRGGVEGGGVGCQPNWRNSGAPWKELLPGSREGWGPYRWVQPQVDGCENSRDVRGAQQCDPNFQKIGADRRVYADGKSCGSYRSVHDEDDGCGTQKIGVDSGDAEAGCAPCATREIGKSWTGDDCGGYCGNRVSARVKMTDECKQWDEDWAGAPGWEACNKKKEWRSAWRGYDGEIVGLTESEYISCFNAAAKGHNVECFGEKDINKAYECASSKWKGTGLASNFFVVGGCKGGSHVTGNKGKKLGIHCNQNCVAYEAWQEYVCSSSGARVTGGEPTPSPLKPGQESVVELEPTPTPTPAPHHCTWVGYTEFVAAKGSDRYDQKYKCAPNGDRASCDNTSLQPANILSVAGCMDNEFDFNTCACQVCVGSCRPN